MGNFMKCRLQKLRYTLHATPRHNSAVEAAAWSSSSSFQVSTLKDANVECRVVYCAMIFHRPTLLHPQPRDYSSPQR